MAGCVLDGQWTSRDWYELALEGEEPQAYLHMGTLYEHGGADLPDIRSVAKAYECYEKAAEVGAPGRAGKEREARVPIEQGV